MKGKLKREEFIAGNQTYTLYTLKDEQLFILETIETKNFKYHPIFHVEQIEPYGALIYREEHVQNKKPVIKYVALEEKVDDKGKPRLYYVKFLYNDAKIEEVKIRFEGAYVKEARAFYNALNHFLQACKCE